MKKFLGCIENKFSQYLYSHPCHIHEINFIFLMNTPHNLPENVQCYEKGERLVWKPLETLHELDLRPPFLKELIPQWLNNKEISCFKSFYQD
jgi:hypothetical protein